jgi:glycosyltransferase involved in cell wall biosynthesis
MRICLVKYGFYENAASLMQFARALVDRGDAVDVIGLRRKDQARFELSDGVRLFRVQKRTVNERTRWAYLGRVLTFFVRCMFLLSKAQVARPYDVIHIQSVPDFLVFAAAIAKLFGAKLILDVHEIVPEFYAAKFNAGRRQSVFRAMVYVEKLAAAFADHILIPNPLWHKRLVRRSVPAEKCSLVRYLPDPKIFYPRSRRRGDDRFLIIYPGTLNIHQGLNIGIKAFARFSATVSGTEFHIYGEGRQSARWKSWRNRSNWSVEYCFTT